MRRATAAALAAALLACLPVLGRELAATRLRAQANAVVVGRGGGEAALRRAVAASGPRRPPSASLDAAAAWVALARAAPDAATRAARLGEADARVREALALRPRSGRAWAEAAYLASLQPAGATPGGGEAATAQALRRSYAGAPLMLHAAPWRTAWAAQHWVALDPALRSRVLDEAGWLQGLPPAFGGLPDGGLGEGAAAVALALRQARAAPPQPRGGAPSSPRP